MRKVAPSSRFSWKSGLLASKSQGLYDHTSNKNDPIQRNKQKPCSTVSQAQNQVQRHSTTGNTTAPPPVHTIITTNQACPLCLNTRETTVHKTASNDGHGKTDSTPAHNKRQDTSPHSMPQHDGGHIHRASLIHGLPPEPLSNNITITVKQQRLNGTNPSQMTACPPNNSDLPTNLTTSARTRNDQNRLRHGNISQHLQPNTTTTASEQTVNETPLADIWGHELRHKDSNTIQILLQNTGGIDHKPGSLIKLAALYDFMQDAQVDIATLTECNTAWDKIDYSLHPTQQTKFWWENAHWSISNNRQDPDSAPYQPGGASIVAVNQVSHRAQRPGDDTAGLGRWCWARLRGKNNNFLRVVSAYRPCPSNGPLSTYQQQMRYWSASNLDCCPRDKFLVDLQKEVERWQAEGDQVIILADMNEDVQAPAIKKFCAALHLVEAISMLHGPARKPTHQRGRMAIDGIYMSRTLLQGSRGGFLQFGDVMGSDHRAVWVDIRAEHVGMVHQDPIISPARRRLKCQDPRIVAKYNQEFTRLIKEQGFEQRVEELYAAASVNQWSTQWSQAYDELDQELTKAKLAAESGCRKFKAGRQPWMPALMQAIQRIMYWKGIAKRAHGGRISTMVLKRRATKGLLLFSSDHWQWHRSEIKKWISSTYNDYFLITTQKQHRETWLSQLVEAMAQARNIPKLRLLETNKTNGDGAESIKTSQTSYRPITRSYRPLSSQYTGQGSPRIKNHRIRQARPGECLPRGSSPTLHPGS